MGLSLWRQIISKKGVLGLSDGTFTSLPVHVGDALSSIGLMAGTFSSLLGLTGGVLASPLDLPGGAFASLHSSLGALGVVQVWLGCTGRRLIVVLRWIFRVSNGLSCSVMVESPPLVVSISCVWGMGTATAHSSLFCFFTASSWSCFPLSLSFLFSPCWSDL